MADRSLIVGGVGGSGTRVVARILDAVGFRTLDDVNAANDALLCTLLFKRPSVIADIDARLPFQAEWGILEDVQSGGRPLSDEQVDLLNRLAAEPRLHHSRKWLNERAVRAIEEARRPRRVGPWYAKEPNLHWVAPAALQIQPELRFVMVVRHGADMAFSRNQNQPATWGASALAPSMGTVQRRMTLRMAQWRARAKREQVPYGVTPQRSLLYWRVVHERILACERAQPDRVLLLSYDQLVSSPNDVLPSLIAFSGASGVDALVQKAAALIKPPASVGRRHSENLSGLDPSDLAWADHFMDVIEGRVGRGDRSVQ